MGRVSTMIASNKRFYANPMSSDKTLTPPPPKPIILNGDSEFKIIKIVKCSVKKGAAPSLNCSATRNARQSELSMC